MSFSFLTESINNESDPSINELSIENRNKQIETIRKLISIDKISPEVEKMIFELASVRFKNQCFINIVEEPEQNLFPSSQKNILFSLLDFNNTNKGNKLILTTHSPYIINYLSISVEAKDLVYKIANSENKNLINDVQKIIPITSTINKNDLVIYQMDEVNGTISKLTDYLGIPSDKNFLNQSLSEGNNMFDSLLEIDEKL